MHNRLIFRYHRVRAHAKSMVAKGLSLRETNRPTVRRASNEGTQEGR